MQKKIAAGVLFASLVSCAGGGGGGGPSIPTPGPAQFTSARAVGRQQTVVMTGISQSATLSGLTPITAVAANSVDANTSVQVTSSITPGIPLSAFDAVSIATAQGSTSWSRSDSPSCINGVCSFSNGTSDLILIGMQNSNIGWNYQTFGIWDNTLSATTRQVGEFSAQPPSPPA